MPTTGPKDQGDSVPRAYLRETSFAHMARTVTEAKAAGVSKWIVDHVYRRRRYCPPSGPKLRKELRHETQGPRGPLLPAPVGARGYGGLLVQADA